jgi:hypothetical protein
MLLPALQKAVFQAQKIACLSDRRQNYIALSYFVNDHDGLVPHPVGGDAGSGPGHNPPSVVYGLPNDNLEWEGFARYGNSDEPDRRIPLMSANRGDHVNANVVVHQHSWGIHGSRRGLGPIGVLAAFGYVENPSMLYCPSYDRVPDDDSYFLDESPDDWDDLTNDDGSYNGRRTYYTGISHFFSYKGPSSTASRSYNRNSRLRDYARYWRDGHEIDGRLRDVSPIMFACLNISARAAGGIEEWGTAHLWRYGTSHSAAGANGVMYDGSARWINREEVEKFGPLIDSWSSRGARGDYLRNDNAQHAHSANMQVWAKEHGTLRAP